LPDLVQFVAEKTVAHYIGRLTPLIKSHGRSALAIAREFAGAEASLSPKDFKVLRNRFRLGYAIACKLVQVGRSDRERASRQGEVTTAVITRARYPNYAANNQKSTTNEWSDSDG